MICEPLRTVCLEGGPADARTVDTTHSWVWICIHDGELLVFDSDRPDAVDVLNRAAGGEWFEYNQNPESPDRYQFTGGLPRFEGNWPPPPWWP